MTPNSLFAFVGALMILSMACGGTQAREKSPPNRCTATMASLQALEPTCWQNTQADGGPNDAGTGQGAQNQQRDNVGPSGSHPRWVCWPEFPGSTEELNRARCVQVLRRCSACAPSGRHGAWAPSRSARWRQCEQARTRRRIGTNGSRRAAWSLSGCRAGRLDWASSGCPVLTAFTPPPRRDPELVLACKSWSIYLSAQSQQIRGLRHKHPTDHGWGSSPWLHTVEALAHVRLVLYRLRMVLPVRNTFRSCFFSLPPTAWRAGMGGRSISRARGRSSQRRVSAPVVDESTPNSERLARILTEWNDHPGLEDSPIHNQLHSRKAQTHRRKAKSHRRKATGHRCGASCLRDSAKPLPVRAKPLRVWAKTHLMIARFPSVFREIPSVSERFP